ncbi:MAG: molybdate transport system ATP-binding protein [Solirubrobacteraceae bacterium]|nr:molybdate transport system ATP-binding protein [Solirubrobacteraceae bacterium]
MLRADLRAQLGALTLDVSLEVPRSRCLALAGPSGAGKSSILRAIAGLVKPEHGHVRCGEVVWLDTDRRIDLAPELRGVGYVFQDYALFGHLRAWQNVAYALQHVPRPQRRARAVALLDRFGAAGIADDRPQTLSGGERQRVALARALAREPTALLLDEPLAALDARTRAAASRELAAVLRGAGVPSLLVTHDFIEAALLGDEVAVVDGGRIVQRGTAAGLAAKPASAFVADFTGAVVLTGHARRHGSVTVVELDGGGRVTALEAAEGPVAVSVYPWDVMLAPPGAEDPGSARNHLPVEVISVTAVGSRVRVGLAAPQPLAAEVSEASASELALVPGARAVASWKAATTRLLPLTDHQTVSDSSS